MAARIINSGKIALVHTNTKKFTQKIFICVCVMCVYVRVFMLVREMDRQTDRQRKTSRERY